MLSKFSGSHQNLRYFFLLAFLRFLVKSNEIFSPNIPLFLGDSIHLQSPLPLRRGIPNAIILCPLSYPCFHWHYTRFLKSTSKRRQRSLRMLFA